MIFIVNSFSSLRLNTLFIGRALRLGVCHQPLLFIWMEVQMLNQALWLRRMPQNPLRWMKKMSSHGCYANCETYTIFKLGII